MIPFIRSIAELMVITQSKDQINKNAEENDLIRSEEDIYQNKRHMRSKDREMIDLPNIPKIKRRRWEKNKELSTSFLNELDYNNEIPSSYDITLQQRENNFNKHDVA